MAFESFIDWEPQKDSTRACLSNAILLINHYGRQGYRMTLRQIYYQMVARDLMPNNRNSYQTLDRVLVLGRMAGWIDWDAIVDRVRRPVKPADWENGADRLRDAAADFRLDRWLGQPCYLEVWSEKDALTGVLEPICSDFHVTYMALRGYSSITAFYDGAKRIEGALEERGQQPTLLYLGDHDPSGVDMSRDLAKRMLELLRQMEDEAPWVDIVRLALTREQVEEYAPRPNPAKRRDTRYKKYEAEHGAESWELDALDPPVLRTLLTEAITSRLDLARYQERVAEEEAHRARMLGLVDVLEGLDTLGDIFDGADR